MNIATIKSAAIKGFSRSALVIKKNSPHILVGAGIAGFATTAVLASKETLAAQPIVEDHKAYMESAKETYSESEDKQEYAKEVMAITWGTAKSLVGVYRPAIAVGCLSVAAVLGSHHIMQQRNLALVAAYNTLDQVYSKYRTEVRTSLGEDKEREIFERANQEGSVKSYSDDGEVVEKHDTFDDYSSYAKWFDESSPYFKKEQDNEYNKMFLRSTQNALNDRLISVGHVFLNEVYDALGMPHTRAGAVVGWVYESGKGDDYIDFGLFDGKTEEARGFINGFSKSVLLDFNVDGVILDLI